MDGRWLKLCRAREHFEAVRGEITAALAEQTPAAAIACWYDPNDQAWVCTTRDVARAPSDRLGILAGDTVHSLRSALDYLVWDLAINDGGKWPLDGNGIPIKTQFPICVCKDDRRLGFDRPAVRDTWLHSVSDRHIAQIESFQPYHTGDDALVLLNQISNEDKHRVIPTTYATDIASQPWIRETRDCALQNAAGELPISNSRLEPNTEILRLPLVDIGPNPHVDVIFQTLVAVTFEDGNPVGPLLVRAITAVETILSSFEPDLSTKAARERRICADLLAMRP